MSVVVVAAGGGGGGLVETQPRHPARRAAPRRTQLKDAKRSSRHHGGDGCEPPAAGDRAAGSSSSGRRFLLVYFGACCCAWLRLRLLRCNLNNAPWRSECRAWRRGWRRACRRGPRCPEGKASRGRGTGGRAEEEVKWHRRGGALSRSEAVGRRVRCWRRQEACSTASVIITVQTGNDVEHTGA